MKWLIFEKLCFYFLSFDDWQVLADLKHYDHLLFLLKAVGILWRICVSQAYDQHLKIDKPQNTIKKVLSKRYPDKSLWNLFRESPPTSQEILDWSSICWIKIVLNVTFPRPKTIVRCCNSLRVTKFSSQCVHVFIKLLLFKELLHVYIQSNLQGTIQLCSSYQEFEQLKFEHFRILPLPVQFWLSLEIAYFLRSFVTFGTFLICFQKVIDL